MDGQFAPDREAALPLTHLAMPCQTDGPRFVTSGFSNQVKMVHRFDTFSGHIEANIVCQDHNRFYQCERSHAELGIPKGKIDRPSMSQPAGDGDS